MRSALLCICLLALGCSAVVNPDETLLGDPPAGDGGIMLMDSGIRLMDSGTPLTDGGPPPPDDGGPPPPDDAGPPPPCDGPPRCDGDTLVTCSEAGLEQRFDCADDEGFCEGAACNDWNCEPGSARCGGGGFASFVCDERGVGETRTTCPTGCVFDTGRCRGDDPPPVTCEDIDAIGLNDDDEVNLCERSNGTSYVAGGDCMGGSDADSGEQVYRLTVERGVNIEVEAYDIDEGSAVDTAVYIRTTCDDPSSQIACDDDVPCGISDFPDGVRCVGGGPDTGGVEVRQSILRARLEPGTYFIVVDAHEYRRGGINYSCGDVRVEVREVDGG